MVNTVPTRIRKRDRRAPDTQVWSSHNWGHSTAGGGTDIDQWIRWHACLWSSREWCEDQNHREKYSIKTLDKDDPLRTILYGTMTRADRGGPLWVRRITNEHFPGVSKYWTRDTGLAVPGQGNWTKLVQSGYQMIGGASFGSGLTSNSGLSQPGSYSVPSKGLINFGLYSPKAWARYKPLNPKVNTLQFLAELSDLPKLYIRCRTILEYFRALGNAYLNWEFGWKPFLKDLQAFLLTVYNLDKIYSQLVRDNGKPVHREGKVFKNEDSSSTSSSVVGPEILSPAYETQAYVDSFGSSTALPTSKTVTTTTQQEYWFSGTFRYYLAPFESFKGKTQMLRIIYGIDLSPRLVWELLPWSWLADWISSVGASIDNLTEINLDSLVASYAYCMGHYRVVEETAWSNGLTTARRTLTSEIKAREQATPFGFGLDTSIFTGRQKAILAALLLAKGT